MLLVATSCERQPPARLPLPQISGDAADGRPPTDLPSSKPRPALGVDCASAIPAASIAEHLAGTTREFGAPFVPPYQDDVITKCAFVQRASGRRIEVRYDCGPDSDFDYDGIQGSVEDYIVTTPETRPTDNCAALTSTGDRWSFQRAVGMTGLPQPFGSDPLFGALTPGGVISRTGRNYRPADLGSSPLVANWLEHELLDQAGMKFVGFDSQVGAFDIFAQLLVTKGGEAWIRTDGGNDYPIVLPPGRRAVAIEGARDGAFVWLDDQRVGYASLPSSGGGGLWMPLPFTAAPPAY